MVLIDTQYRVLRCLDHPYTLLSDLDNLLVIIDQDMKIETIHSKVQYTMFIIMWYPLYSVFQIALIQLEGE